MPPVTSLFHELVDRLYEYGKALRIAEFFEIDDVIDPADTRRWITALLESAPPRPLGTSPDRTSTPGEHPVCTTGESVAEQLIEDVVRLFDGAHAGARRQRVPVARVQDDVVVDFRESFQALDHQAVVAAR